MLLIQLALLLGRYGTLMNKLPMFKNCQKDSLKNSKWLESQIINTPSSPLFVIK